MTGSKAASRNSTTRFWNGSVSMRFIASLLPEKCSVPHLEYMLVKCQARWKEQQPPSNSSLFLGRNFFGLCGECQDLRRTGRRDRETELDLTNLRTFPRHRPKSISQTHHRNTHSTMATALALGFGIAATAFFVRRTRISSATTPTNI